MADLIRQSLLFPIIQSIHILALAGLVGAVALLDVRLLNLGLRHFSPRALATRLAPWTTFSLVAIAVTGPALFLSDASRYMKNPAFLLKLGLLVVALALHVTLHRSVVESSSPDRSTRRKLAAVLSLALWSSVVFAGRAIADFDIYRN